jgi:hypothetical protein
MAIHIRKAMVLALMRAYNDSPPTHTITITKDGTISAGPKALPFSVWQCLPTERQAGETLSFNHALELLTGLEAQGVFRPR